MIEIELLREERNELRAELVKAQDAVQKMAYCLGNDEDDNGCPPGDLKIPCDKQCVRCWRDWAYGD